jgi:enoyl-CoA hydratase
MSTPVTYELEDAIATITMDDGKVNVMSLEMLTEINAALDQALADRAVVVLTGRVGVFSAGFDLPVLRGGGSKAIAMVRTGFELAERVLSFPLPVVIASTGHAVAMGVFLLVSGDYRLGTSGNYKLTANEVAIGLTMPRAAVEILRQRLTPAAFNRAVTIAEPFSPANAVEAGFLDRIVNASELPTAAHATAVELTKLDLDAHARSKRRARARTLEALHAAIETDYAGFRESA